MTSYVLEAHTDRPLHPEWEPTANKTCIFCQIVAKKAKAYVVWEDEATIAFLDKMPMRRGHVLLIPKMHCVRIADLPEEIGAALGRALPKLTKALSLALDNPDLNVVLNQGYAQAVHHAHFHLIPAPLPAPPPDLSSLSLSLSTPTLKPKSKSKKSNGVSERTPADLRANPPSHQEMLDGERAFRLPGMLGDKEGEEVKGLIRGKL